MVCCLDYLHLIQVQWSWYQGPEWGIQAWTHHQVAETHSSSWTAAEWVERFILVVTFVHKTDTLNEQIRSYNSLYTLLNYDKPAPPSSVYGAVSLPPLSVSAFPGGSGLYSCSSSFDSFLCLGLPLRLQIRERNVVRHSDTQFLLSIQHINHKPIGIQTRITTGLASVQLSS